MIMDAGYGQALKIFRDMEIRLQMENLYLLTGFLIFFILGLSLKD